MNAPADRHDPSLPINGPGFSDSRRRFLAATAGVAAAGALVAGVRPAAARGRPEEPAAKARDRAALADGDTIRIGVIGLGGPNGCAMGLGHCLNIAALAKKQKEKVEIVAICDVNQLHIEHGKSEIEKAQPGVKVDTYARHEDLLARDDLHGVIAAVPEHWHGKIGIDTILAGKDLYLEKPMTLDLPDALALYRVAQANPHVIAQVGTQKTRMPKYLEARKLISSGMLGTTTFSQTSYCRNSRKGEWHYKVNPAWKPGVNIDWERWCGPLGPMEWDPKLYYQWRRYRKTSTGIIGDLLVHEMTPMLMAIDQGWPVRVAATGAHLVDKAMENPDNVHIVVQFETGHQMFVCGSTCNEAGVETMIRGHKGNIYLASRHCDFRPERTYVDDLDPQKIECPDIGDDQDAHRLGWLRSIRTREAPLSSVELGLKVMVIVDLATRSIWEGGAFTFDPRTMTTSKA